MRALLAVMSACLLSTTAAASPPQCATYPRLRDVLASEYAEAPVWRGINSRGEVIEIFATVDGATWTAMVVSPTGNACMVSSGEGGEPVQFRLPPMSAAS